MSANNIPFIPFVDPNNITGTENNQSAQINAILAQQILGSFPNFKSDGTGNLTTAAVIVSVAMLVELRVISSLLNSTNDNLDQLRASELNNVVPPGGF